MTKALTGIVALLATLFSTSAAMSQASYPDRPIRMIVAFPPGGPSDIVARLMAEKLTEALGKPAVVENVSGASGNIGTERAAKSTPDGHTLLISAPGPLVVNPSLFQKVPFDPLRDFAPISQLCYTPNVLVVNNDVPAKSVQELIALARKNPGELSFASGGAGTSNHLAAELFKFMAGVNLQHVPYRGVSVSVPDIIGGRIPVAFLSMATALPLVRDGKLRALAVGTPARWPAAPEIPTMDESGVPGFTSTVWHSFLAPAGTPPAIVERLHRETMRILALPDVRRIFDDNGLAVIGSTPAEFAAVIKAEGQQWAKVIKQSGLKAGN
ncbi:MAG: tripartite tricarboxylate transporter substrate binding protein [Xanthobacteraceae bacterium]|nr:tripartite tricarboxylate transporter substrate binding protein [Xanthobacteraceae bacterium]